jgi:hypothetical protein
MAELWSDYTDSLISDIDAQLGSKYGKMNLRKFLGNPGKFAEQPNINTDFQNLRKDADAYIDALFASLGTEKQEFEDNLLKADTITAQLGNSISMQAKQLKIPFIKPALMERDDSVDEKIYIDTVNTDIFSLIEKLATTAVYIADNTEIYKDRKIGDWLFGGSKSYVLRVYVPQNQVMILDNSRDEINALFDIAANSLKDASA